ncbi:MAG: hypothetical protein E2O76_02895 [Caldithrix sp.]|nr:MAG: hypothetical protein E2O76_02895 [Caldithrix sp.]
MDSPSLPSWNENHSLNGCGICCRCPAPPRPRPPPPNPPWPPRLPPPEPPRPILSRMASRSISSISRPIPRRLPSLMPIALGKSSPFCRGTLIS